MVKAVKSGKAEKLLVTAQEVLLFLADYEDAICELCKGRDACPIRGAYSEHLRVDAKVITSDVLLAERIVGAIDNLQKELFLIALSGVDTRSALDKAITKHPKIKKIYSNLFESGEEPNISVE